MLRDASPVSDSLDFFFIRSHFLGCSAACGSAVLDGTVHQKFACPLCRDRIPPPRHAIQTKFIGAILHSAPAGGSPSRQFAERNSYSLQVHIIVAVIFREQSEGNDQSKGAPPHSSVHSEGRHLCGKITGLRHR